VVRLLGRCAVSGYRIRHGRPPACTGVDKPAKTVYGFAIAKLDDHDARSITNTDVAYARLREAVLRGELEAGSVVSQARLAELLDVGRTPLREAIRLVQREGLIEARSNHRPRVADLSWTDLEELYAMRMALEASAAHAAVPMFDASDIARMREAIARFELAAKQEGIEAASVHHRAFHMQLVVGERMEKLTADLWDHSERYRRLFFVGDSRLLAAQAEHHEIIDACERGAALEAGRLVALHLARTALTVLAEKAPEYEPALIRSTLRLISAADGDPVP
jgi:DNA-binding GntR family transcriptional regulator